MADPASAARANLLAAIRAKGPKPAVEVSRSTEVRVATPPAHVSKPLTPSPNGEILGEMPRRPAPAALALKAAMAQMGGNVRSTLKSSNQPEKGMEKGAVTPPIKAASPQRPPLAASRPAGGARPPPLAFSAADLLAARQKIVSSAEASKKEGSSPEQPNAKPRVPSRPTFRPPAPPQASGPERTSFAAAIAAAAANRPKKLDLGKVTSPQDLNAGLVPESAKNTERSDGAPVKSPQRSRSPAAVLSYRQGVQTPIDPPAKNWARGTTPRQHSPRDQNTPMRCQQAEESSVPVIKKEVTSGNITPPTSQPPSSSPETAADELTTNSECHRQVPALNTTPSSKKQETPRVETPVIPSKRNSASSVRRRAPEVATAERRLGSLTTVSPDHTASASRRRKTKEADAEHKDRDSNRPHRRNGASASRSAPRRPSTDSFISNVAKGPIQYDSTGKYRLLTDPADVQRAWRRLSCKVLPEDKITAYSPT